MPLFDSLPNEILTKVLSNVSDLETLDSLLRACPRMWRLFDQHGRQSAALVEKILSGGSLHPQIARVLRVTEYLRKGSLPIDLVEPPESDKEFDFWHRKRFIWERDWHHQNESEPRASSWILFEYMVLNPTIGWRMSERRTGWMTTLPDNTSPIDLRRILAVHRRLTGTMLQCIQYYLTRFSTLASYQLDEKDMGEPFAFDISKQSLSELPHGGLYRAADPRSPSWIEEQRVMMALWRLHFVAIFKMAIQDEKISFGKTKNKSLEYESARSILGWYRPLCHHTHPDYELATLQDEEQAWGQEYSKLSVLEFIEAKRLLSDHERRSYTHRPWPIPVQQEHDIITMQDHPGQVAEQFVTLFPPAQIYCNTEKNSCHDTDLPERTDGFYPWRRWGFGIWDRSRLRVSGFSWTCEHETSGWRKYGENSDGSSAYRWCSQCVDYSFKEDCLKFAWLKVVRPEDYPILQDHIRGLDDFVARYNESIDTEKI